MRGSAFTMPCVCVCVFVCACMSTSISKVHRLSIYWRARRVVPLRHGIDSSSLPVVGAPKALKLWPLPRSLSTPSAPKRSKCLKLRKYRYIYIYGIYTYNCIHVYIYIYMYIYIYIFIFILFGTKTRNEHWSYSKNLNMLFGSNTRNILLDSQTLGGVQRRVVPLACFASPHKQRIAVILAPHPAE